MHTHGVSTWWSAGEAHVRCTLQRSAGRLPGWARSHALARTRCAGDTRHAARLRLCVVKL